MSDFSTTSPSTMSPPSPTFEQSQIEDWSTCDWYCVKVRVLFFDRGEDRRERAEAIAACAAWAGRWQRRGAAVASSTSLPR